MAKTSRTSRKMVGIWLSEEDRAAFMELTEKDLGYDSLAELARDLCELSPGKRALVRQILEQRADRDGRSEYMLLRLRPGEHMALAKTAERLQLSPEEELLDMVRKHLHLPTREGIGGLPSENETFNPKDEIRRLTAELEGDHKPFGNWDGAYNMMEAFNQAQTGKVQISSVGVKATLDVLSGAKPAMKAIEKVLAQMSIVRGPKGEVHYVGVPRSQDVLQVLTALEGLDRAGRDRLRERHNIQSRVLISVWIKLWAGSERDEA
jgi:hypothetical protein